MEHQLRPVALIELEIRFSRLLRTSFLFRRLPDGIEAIQARITFYLLFQGVEIMDVYFLTKKNPLHRWRSYTSALSSQVATWHG